MIRLIFSERALRQERHPARRILVHRGNVISVLFLGLLLAPILSCGSTWEGLVTDRGGDPASNTAVRVVTMGDDGEINTLLDSVLTDEKGKFSVSGFSPDGDGTLAIFADFPNETLRGFFVTASGQVRIHPLTEAWVTLVTDITGTEGGATLSDYSNVELQAMAEAIFREDLESLDFEDSEVLKNFLRKNLGREIALASGGEISGISTESFEGKDSTKNANFDFGTTVCAGRPVEVLESDEFRFDVENDGSLCGDSSDTLTNMLLENAVNLQLPSEVFFGFDQNFPANAGGAIFRNNRQIELPFQTLEVSPLTEDPDFSVARRIFVPTSGDYIRYLEVFRNTSNTDRIVTFEVQTRLSSGNDTALLTFDTNSGSPSTKDRFVVAYDLFASRPSVGVAFQGEGAETGASILRSPGLAEGDPFEISFGWEGFTIPANSRRTFLHFLLLSASKSADDLHDQMTALVENPKMKDISLTDLKGLVNFFPNRGTISGEAGSVIGLALVTAKNRRSNEEIVLTARRDGSFDILLDGAPGDEVRVQASDDLDQMITIKN